MRRLAVILGLTVAVTAPAAAHATATTVYRSPNTLQRPALAGERILTVESQPPRGLRLLSIPVAGGSPTQLFEADGEPRSGVWLAAAGSDSRVYVRRASEGGPSAIFSGPRRGPLSQVQLCNDLDFAAGPAADGNVVAWVGGDCQASRIHVQSGDASRVADAGDFVHTIAVADPYVAWLAMERPADAREVLRTRLVVQHAATGQTVLTTLVPPSINLDVQSDGTAALATYAPATDRSCNGGPAPRILWYSIAEPFGHELPNARPCEAVVAIAANRIAYADGPAPGSPSRFRMLTLADLAGTVTQPVARIDAFPPLPAFDWDGQRLAWSQLRCRDSVLRLRDAADTSTPDAAVRCPVHVGTPRLHRDRTIHVPLACPNGCRSLPHLGLTIFAPRWLHVRGTRTSTRYMPYRAFSLRPGARTIVRLPTTRHQRALIRRKRRVSVRLKVVAQNVSLPRIARTLRSR